MYHNTQEDWDFLRQWARSPEMMYVGWIRPSGAPAALTCYTEPHPPVSDVRLEGALFFRADSRAEAEQRWAERNGSSVPALQSRVRELEAAIRMLRDDWQNGDDKCWKDLEALFTLLPEGYQIPARDELVELDLCRRYIASCHHPGVAYISPQRRIEELEAEVAQLRAAWAAAAAPKSTVQGLAATIGKWPGDESDEQINKALEELS